MENKLMRYLSIDFATIHVGQVVALIEAMKVFNEINAEVSGRLTAIIATNGNVVQKGDVLMRVEPL